MTIRHGRSSLLFGLVGAALAACSGPVADPYGSGGNTPPDGAGGPDEFALLGGPRGGNAWSKFCAGKADDAVLPPDPRTLLVPGVN